jgi:hypothetical protein
MLMDTLSPNRMSLINLNLHQNVPTRGSIESEFRDNRYGRIGTAVKFSLPEVWTRRLAECVMTDL